MFAWYALRNPSLGLRQVTIYRKFVYVVVLFYVCRFQHLGAYIFITLFNAMLKRLVNEYTAIYDDLPYVIMYVADYR